MRAPWPRRSRVSTARNKWGGDDGGAFTAVREFTRFHLVPKVSEALWERRRGLKLRFPLTNLTGMRSRYYAREKERAYFVTSTIVDWLPVFAVSGCGEVLAQSLDFCRREKGLRLYAWVIMENHFHAVVQAEDLSRIMADLKKFTANQLLRLLAERRQEWLLELLAKVKAAHKRASRFQLWQEGFHPQAIYSDRTMQQKIDYVHHNPVRRGWVASPEHWRFSSAHEWLPGASPIIRSDAWR